MNTPPDYNNLIGTIAPLVQNWLDWAEKIIELGGYPAFPALSDTAAVVLTLPHPAQTTIKSPAVLFDVNALERVVTLDKLEIFALCTWVIAA